MFGFGKKKKEPEVRQIEVPIEDEFSIGEDIHKGVDTAFEIGAKWLDEQDAVLYLFFMNEGKCPYFVVSALVRCLAATSAGLGVRWRRPRYGQNLTRIVYA